jgi:hypothetical protein
MNTIAMDSRAKRALTVVGLVSDGMTVGEACKQAGIPRSSYYAFQRTHPEYLAALQDQLLLTTYANLLSLLRNRVELLERLIQDALNDDTSPSDRLAIFKAMEKQLQDLASDSRLSGSNIDAATDVLSGPVLTPGISRFSSR